MYESQPEPRSWAERAATELPQVQSADALLAFLLEYLSGREDSRDREFLIQIVVTNGRFLEPRVLAVLLQAGNAHRYLPECPSLSPEAAEWLATILVTGIGVPNHLIAARVYGEWADALRAVIKRHKLSSNGLAGRVLHHEANVRRPELRNEFSRGALERLLYFPDLDEASLATLERAWKGNGGAAGAIADYRRQRGAIKKQ